MSIEVALCPVTTLRPVQPADAESCGRICFEAFHAIASHHNFPDDFPSVEIATALLRDMIGNPGYFGVVAELNGQVVGSNFLDERSLIAGVGPITIDPNVQNQGVGRALMSAALDRVTLRGAPGVRLLQSAYHGRSLSLYTTLGFVPRGAMACMQGEVIDAAVPGYTVRAAQADDLDACNQVCVAVHGHHRGPELREAIEAGNALVVEHDDRITGYATDLAFFAHAVAETNHDMMALLGSARPFKGPGIIVPLANGALFRWCLFKGLKVVQTMTLMSVGLYNEPAGAYLPSVVY